MHGALANVLSLFTRTGIQLIQIPLLVAHWHAPAVGVWLMLWTLPGYLALSSLGFGAAGGNALTAAGVRGDVPAAQSIFKGIWLFVSSSNLLFSASLFLFLGLFAATARAGAVPVEQVQQAIFWLCAYMFVRSQYEPLEAALRYSGRYPVYIYLDQASALAELAVTAVVVSVSDDLSMLALGLMLTRLAILPVLAVIALRHAPILLRGWRPREIVASVRRLMLPSLAFVFGSFTLAINLQGYSWLVGAVFGPVALTVFVTIRTLVRLMDMALNYGFNLLFYEAAYLDEDGNEVRRNILLNLGFAFFTVSAIYAGFLFVAGFHLHRIWTLGAVAFDYGVLAALCGALILRALCLAPAALLSAANRNAAYNLVYLLSAALSLSGALATAHLTGRLDLTVSWLIVAEGLPMIAVNVLAARYLGLDLRTLVRGVFNVRARLAFAWTLVSGLRRRR